MGSGGGGGGNLRGPGVHRGRRGTVGTVGTTSGQIHRGQWGQWGPCRATGSWVCGSSSRLLGIVGVHGDRGSLCRDLGSWVAMAVGKGRFCWGPADHTCSLDLLRVSRRLTCPQASSDRLPARPVCLSLCPTCLAAEPLRKIKHCQFEKLEIKPEEKNLKI